MALLLVSFTKYWRELKNNIGAIKIIDVTSDQLSFHEVVVQGVMLLHVFVNTGFYNM